MIDILNLQNSTKSISAIIPTGGDGFWSTRIRAVELLELRLPYVSKNKEGTVDHGELHVCFNTKTWNVDKHGLIYTDSRFLLGFQKLLVGLGFSEVAASSVDYSEQGMQGKDHISFDVGFAFLSEALAIFSTQ